jgi:hypothetical protein
LTAQKVRLDFMVVFKYDQDIGELILQLVQNLLLLDAGHQVCVILEDVAPYKQSAPGRCASYVFLVLR